jgi:hypothetical protein
MPENQNQSESAFEHPAAKEANKVFLTLEVYSEEDYRKLPLRDRYVWDICWFEVEITNGGMDQYLLNSAGDNAGECLEALEAIGAKQAYRLLKNAFDLFPDGRPSADRDVRESQMQRLAGANRIDDMIHGEIEVDLYQRLLDYYHRPRHETRQDAVG